MASPKCNYQFMFFARLILGNKLHTSHFIYTTKKPKPKQQTNKSENKEILHRFLKKFKHKKHHFICAFLI